MKGKKFDAHEKHFKKKEDKLKKEIKYLEDRYQDVCKESLHFELKTEELTEKLIDIKAKYQRLLEYSKLSDAEIIEALKRDKSVNQFVEIFDAMGEISKF